MQMRFRVPFCMSTLFTYTAHVCHCCTCARPAHLNTPALQPTDSHSCRSDLRIATLLTNPNPVGAVLWCIHPNAICIPNRTGSSADTLDMDNPENLVILKILVQTNADAVQSAILYSPHTVRVCHCCTCARPAHLNTPALQPTDHSLSCPSDLRIATLLTNPNPVGAVLWCIHPNAICIPNRIGSSAETLDMANPENLVILKILVQTNAVQSVILYASTFFTS